MGFLTYLQKHDSFLTVKTVAMMEYTKKAVSALTSMSRRGILCATS